MFEFDETKVREVMTPRTDIIAVEKNVGIENAVKLVIQSGHSRLPVYEERIDNIIGLLLAKDLFATYQIPNMRYKHHNRSHRSCVSRCLYRKANRL